MLVRTNNNSMSLKRVYEAPTVDVVELQYEGVICASMDDYDNELII